MASVTLAGQTLDCLLDSGSQVSFVTEAFFKRAIEPQGHELRSARNWLTIRAADGLEVPYVGYFETDVCVAGQVVADRAILVVRDSGQSLPGLLGMNVLANIPLLTPKCDLDLSRRVIYHLSHAQFRRQR